jgi:glycosyltransferase involved in cell wall biosynthesis
MSKIMPTKFDIIQLGFRNSYQVAIGLNEIGALNRLITDFYLSDELMRLSKFMNISKINKLRNRNSPDIKSSQVFSTESLFSFIYNKNIDYIHYINNFYRQCGSYIKSDYIYCLAEAPIFRELNGHYKVLEIVLSQREDFLIESEIQELKPEFKNSNILSIKSKLAFIEENSIHYADMLVFPSEYVYKKTSEHYDLGNKKCFVNNYWCPKPYFTNPIAVKKLHAGQEMIILFVGRVSLVKGCDVLLDLIDSTQDLNIRFMFVGNLEIDFFPFLKFKNVIFLGHVNKHVLDGLYRKAHLMIFPTRNEGSALISYESMAYGLPMITTPNCGSTYIDNLHGRIGNYFDFKSIRVELEKITKNPGLIEFWSSNCLNSATENTAADYRLRTRSLLSI